MDSLKPEPKRLTLQNIPTLSFQMTEESVRHTPATCQTCKTPFSMREVFALDQWIGCGLCPACEDAAQAAIGARYLADAQAARLRRWQAMDMPFQDADSATDRALLPALQAKRVLDWPHSRTGLVIAGETGMGKSRTIVEMLRDRWVIDGIECSFIRFTQWRQQLDKSHRHGGEGVDRFVRPFIRVPILCIDDLGHGKFTENNLACFFELLDARTCKGLPTHFTTQHSKETLKAAFDSVNPKTSEAIIRRLSEFNRLVTFTPLLKRDVTPSNA